MTKQREKNLIKNTSFLAIGTFVPKLFAFIVTPLLTGNLTQGEYGQYDLITTLVSLLLPAVSLQINSAAFRFLIDARENNDDTKHIVSSIFGFVSLITLATSLAFYISYGWKLGINGVLVCFYFAVDMYLQMTQQIMRGLGKNLQFSISSIISTGVNTGMLICLISGKILPNYGLTGVIISLLVSSFAATVFLLVTGDIYKYISLNGFSWKTTKSMLAYSWPMVPNNLSGWVLRLSDRLVITAVLGIEANAMYAVANKFPALISSFQAVFIFAWQENASLAAKDDDKGSYYSNMCNWIYKLLVGFVAVIICVTPLMWRVLIRGDYEYAYYQLPVLYLGIFFACISSIVGGIYIAFKKTLNVGITTTLAAIVNLIIDLGLVSIIGIWAGSISTMVSYLFLLIYRMINVQKFQNIKFDLRMMFGGLVLLITMSFLSVQRTIVFDSINLVICIIAIIVFDRDIVKTMINSIRRRVLKGKC